MKTHFPLTFAIMFFVFTQMIVAQNQEIRLIKKDALQKNTPAKTVRKPNSTKATHQWTGTVSSDWNTAGNWSPASVPTSSDYVTIPSGTPHSPVIGSGVTAYCDGVYLYSGANLDQNAGSWFYCYGVFDAGFGQFTMNGSSYLYFRGNYDELWYDDNQNDTYTYVRVEKGSSTAKMTMQNDMTCSGTFQIREGVFAFKDHQTLNVTNTGTNAFVVENGGKLKLTDYTTMWIFGGIVFKNGSQFEGGLNCAWVLEGNLLIESNSLYDIEFASGLLQMSGPYDQYIQYLDGTVLNLYGFTISKSSGTCYLANADISVSFVNISNGTLSCRSAPGSGTIYDIYVDWAWFSNEGDPGFDQANGRVVFNGSNVGYCEDSEVFYELELDNPDGLTIKEGADVVCSAYDWTQGTLEVESGASFTANDLLDNAVQGGFILNDGGTINLTNSGTGTFVDLKGDLQILGGTMNITGSFSWWPYDEDASIEMSGGVLDLTSCGIQIDDNAYSLTTNITGGTIRTAGGFAGNRADFAPAAGTFEFYGTSNANLSQTNGCTLYNVNIDKSAKGTGQLMPGLVAPDGRTDVTIGQGKDNLVSITENFTLTNDLVITSGSLSLTTKELEVDHNIDVYGELHINNVANVLTMGQHAFDHLTFYPGSTGDFTAGTVNMYGGIYTNAGCSFTATTDNTVVFKGDNAVGFNNWEPTAVYGNIEVLKNPGKKLAISNNSSEPVVVNGNFTIHPNCILETQTGELIVHGTFYDDATSIIYVYETDGGTNPEGYLEIDNDFGLFGLLDVGVGNVVFHNDFNIDVDGHLIINGGSVVCDKPYEEDCYFYMNGIFDMSDGLFEVSENSLMYAFAGTNDISGGTIRIGRNFSSTATAGVFVPTGGTVEMIGAGAIYCYPGNWLHNLTINHTFTTGYSIYETDLNVKNNLVIETLGLKSDAGKDIYVGGDWTDISGGFLPGTATVIFNGSGAADITTDETFYNLELDKTYSDYDGLELNNGITINVLNDLEITDGTLEMNDNSSLNVDGDVHIALDAGLNAFNDTGLSLFIGGNWTDDNTSYNSIKGYTPGTELITFDGAIDQEITTNAMKEDFGNMIIDKSSGQFRPGSNIDVMYDLMINDGQWNDLSSGLTHYFEGDFEVGPSGAYFTHLNHNTATFKGSSDQNITYNSSWGYFYNIVIDKTSWTAKESVQGGEIMGDNINQSKAPNSLAVNLTTDIDMEWGDGLTIEEGTLNLNGNMITNMGDVNINDGGTLFMDANSVLRVNEWLLVNSGGSLVISGTFGNWATIENYDILPLHFTTNPGGNISAEYGYFNGLSGFGVFVAPGAIVDPAHAFNHCVFGDAQKWKLTMNSSQDLVCTGANFLDAGEADNNVRKWDASGGSITFHNAIGDFAGPEYENDDGNLVFWDDMDIELEMTVILEGPYNGTDMNTDLNTLGLIPLTQPFDSNPAAQWYYTGTESVGAIPANVVDWVLVQLRDAADAASATASSVVAQQAAFLLNDGSIVGLDGTSNLSFTGTGYSMGLFPAVFQRNHLGIVSSAKMVRTGGVYTYDFTAAGSAYGDTQAGEKNLGGGVYGMFAGDASGDGKTNEDDLPLWRNDAGKQDYLPADFNMDSQANNTDKNDFLVPNNGKESQLPVGVCGSPLLDARNNQSYATVQIGTQCWMAENLNIGTMINGSNDQTDNATIEKYCYDDNTANCDVYGGLYQWDEMMEYVTAESARGICPDGWHLPSDNEWKTLEIYLGMSQAEADAEGWRGADEGGKLKEAGTGHWASPNLGATNSSDFTALPGGYREEDGLFYYFAISGHFWSSSESGSFAKIRHLSSDFSQVFRNNTIKTSGFRVRCVRD